MTIDIVLHEAAYDRVRQRLEQLGVPHRALTLDNEGTVSHDGAPANLAEFTPEVAWFSLDMARPERFNAALDLMLAQPNIQWMQTFNAGLDNPRYKEVAAAGIRVGKSSAQAVAISEYTFAHVLDLYQPLETRRQAQRDHRWQPTPFREIWRTTWLVVGLGNIGQEVAKRAHAFGATVLAVRRSDAPADFVDEIHQPSALPGLLPRADVTVLACPLTHETTHMADAAFFQSCKKGSILVNIGRGGLIDDAALLAALDQEIIGTAILDVFDPEPLPETNPYWSHPNVVVTAHTSFGGNGTLVRGDELFLANLPRYAAGEPLLNEVDMTEILQD